MQLPQLPWIIPQDLHINGEISSCGNGRALLFAIAHRVIRFGLGYILGVVPLTEEELNSRVPIIPHATIADTDCPGCLAVGLKDGAAEVLCNECGSLIASMPVREVESFFQNLYDSP